VIFFYTKSGDWTWNDVFTPYDESYVGRDYRLKDEETGRQFRRGDLTAARPGRDTEYDWRVKRPEVTHERWSADSDDEYLNPKPGWEYKAVRPYTGRYWAYSKDNMRQFAEDGRLRHTFDGMPEYKRYLDEMPWVPLQDLWTDITPIIAGTRERLDYPTQKPVSLLERIVLSSSNEGGIVLDPFCGCGTTIHAAKKLNRQWIGIDITHLAIALVERRLKDAFPGIIYEVHGVPQDAAGARDLAERDKHQFQMWITAKIGAQPYKGGKKGMDRGIDGYLHFRDADKKPQFAIISVKGGGIKSGDIRDLKGTMEREKAALGLFLTLNEPTREMEREAAAAGIYETGGMKFSRLQILTAEQILDNRQPQVPFGFSEGFKKAAREKTDEQQGTLL
jgi:site-specific DNA-methyltransferase (adenine-specific)